MEKLLKNIYIGYSEAPNNGEICDSGNDEMFPYENSSILEGAGTDKVFGWRMTPEKLIVFFQFPGGTKLNEIEIDTCSLKKEDCEIWGTAQILISYSAEESGEVFLAVDKIYPTNDGFNKKIVLDKNVHFVRMEIKRNPWRCYPMPKILFFGEENEEVIQPINKEMMNKLFAKETVQVDEYGQSVFLEWQGKIKSDEQMQKNILEEKEKYAEPFVENEKYDKYGGVRNFLKLEATGFFRVEKVEGVWWFVTPEGNPYVLKGVDLVDYSDMSYISPIYIKGTDNIRGVFEKLTDKNKFPCAYEKSEEGYDVINYLRLNLYRKYGENYDDEWVDITHKRLYDWGFNSASKWKKHPKIKMPYIHHLGTKGNFKRVGRLVDPYDNNFSENVENSVKDILPKMKDDPYLIGYHYTSENGFDREIFNIMLGKKSDCPMKCAFVDFIKDKIPLEVINENIDKTVDNYEALADTKLPEKLFSTELMNEFITATAKIYYKVIRDALKKYDPNHLFLGTALTPEWQSTYAWNIGGVEYLDVLSFDYYCRSNDKWIERYVEFDCPIINIEYSFTASDRGLSPIFDCIHCASQTERGDEYKKLMEYNFSFPQYVGSGFFILYDQPLTGRCNGDGSYGECHNFGLIDITDEPYWDFVDIVKETHSTIENIHAKKKIV